VIPSFGLHFNKAHVAVRPCTLYPKSSVGVMQLLDKKD
jgi:hypothetical protein